MRWDFMTNSVMHYKIVFILFEHYLDIFEKHYNLLQGFHVAEMCENYTFYYDFIICITKIVVWDCFHGWGQDK